MRPYLLSALIFLSPFAALAQLGDTPGSLDPFTLSVTPQYVTPYSRATIFAQSSSLNLANATMVVTVAGKDIYQGGVHSVPIPIGKAGDAVVVKVKITSGGTSYTQTVSIQPQDVSIVVEPVSSAPVLYPGKPAVPAGGTSRIVAVANMHTARGVAVDPTTLSYSWTVDDTQIESSSGIGRSSLLVASPIAYRSRPVSVTVTNPDSTLIGGDSTTLYAKDPSVRIYINDPLLGIRFDHALADTYAIAGAEATLYGAPFSFPITSGAPLLQWFLNGALAQAGASITLRPTGSGQGGASLSLTASSGQSNPAVANLSLTFGAAASSNFLGL